MREMLYLTDCEGPVSKNDNAFELAEHFVPEGGAFFAKVSRYDDYLADIEKKPGYKAGDTLKLIVPFLKAHGATDDAVREFSSRGLVLVPRADEMLHAVASLMPAYIISTSYRPYIEALCAAITFPVSNTYCTEIRLDSHVLPDSEVKLLKALTEEILALPKIDLPAGATSFDQLDDGSRRTIHRLNEIIWKELAPLESGRMISSVDPLGGTQKARAVESAREQEGCDWRDVVYVGDSITDREAMALVRSHGGTSISFNGNRYALESAEYAVISQDAFVCALLAQVLRDNGTDGLESLVEGWQQREFPHDIVPDEMRPELEKTVAGHTTFARITAESMPELTTASEHVRKSLRGTKIGSLG